MTQVRIQNDLLTKFVDNNESLRTDVIQNSVIWGVNQKEYKFFFLYLFDMCKTYDYCPFYFLWLLTYAILFNVLLFVKILY